MIPDKIYTFQDDGDRYWYKPEEWETPPLTRVEYIRKDALLDWAKEQASITEKLNGKGAMLKAWDTLIGKLNSI